MAVQPITNDERDRLCSEALNTYLFDKVWNEPVSEFRVNIKPLLFKNRSVIGTLPLLAETIRLPEQGIPYYVWTINPENINIGLNLTPNTWVTSTSIANEHRVLLNFYGVSGAMFHKEYVHLRYCCSDGVILIAAEKAMVQKCIPSNSLDNVFLTVYYDSDRENELKVLSFTVESSLRLDAWQTQLDDFLAEVDNPDQLQIYKNGLEITDINDPPVPEIGVYYDLILDRNIEFAFDVDLVNNNDDPIYYSDRDQCYKQLIHIPKALNPDNRLFTHNTCDFFIRKALSSKVEGYYMHRASGRSVTQVTHNDFGIPLFILDAYRDYLAEQLINIHIVVRKHDKDNVLVRDANFIDILYCDKHTDADIINILIGKGPTNITWWTAQHLEASKYVEMMFDTPNFNFTSHMADYISALGFYQVVQILCQRIYDTKIDTTQPTGISYNLPLLYAGYDVIPVLYRDGKRITYDQYRYTVNETNTIDIEFLQSNINWKDSILSTIFYINGNNQVTVFTPTELKLSCTVPYTSVDVYEKITAQGNTTPQGVNTTSHVAYRKLSLGANQYSVTPNEDGTATVVFNSTMTGTTFIIFNQYCTYHLSYDLSSYTTTGKSIAIRAEITGTDGNVYPILNFQNVSVYLNGDYLVNGIDYFINTVTDSDNNISFREIVIQTMDHFSEDGSNLAEVLFSIEETEDLSSGFMIDNRLQDATPVNLYFPRLTMTHVDGQLERDAITSGVYLTVTPGKYQQGDIFEIQTSIPKFVMDYVSQWAPNQDLERIKVMNDYFYNNDPIDKPVIVLEDKHRNYSIYLNNMLWDIAHGTTGLVDDPDENRFLSQLEQYSYLKDIDLCYKDLDQRFIDFYPQYVNYEIDPTTKNLFDRLIKTLMPENVDATMEVVYTS